LPVGTAQSAASSVSGKFSNVMMSGGVVSRNSMVNTTCSAWLPAASCASYLSIHSERFVRSMAGQSRSGSDGVAPSSLIR
jgi:hypothetical protein